MDSQSFATLKIQKLSIDIHFRLQKKLIKRKRCLIFELNSPRLFKISSTATQRSVAGLKQAYQVVAVGTGNI